MTRVCHFCKRTLSPEETSLKLTFENEINQHGTIHICENCFIAAFTGGLATHNIVNIESRVEGVI